MRYAGKFQERIVVNKKLDFDNCGCFRILTAAFVARKKPCKPLGATSAQTRTDSAQRFRKYALFRPGSEKDDGSIDFVAKIIRKFCRILQYFSDFAFRTRKMLHLHRMKRGCCKLTFSELKQKDVVNICDGRRLGKPIDLVFGETARIEAIVVPLPGNLLSLLKQEKEGCMLPWSRIMRIGDDVILVEVHEQDYPEMEREGNST